MESRKLEANEESGLDSTRAGHGRFKQFQSVGREETRLPTLSIGKLATPSLGSEEALLHRQGSTRVLEPVPLSSRTAAGGKSSRLAGLKNRSTIGHVLGNRKAPNFMQYYKKLISIPDDPVETDFKIRIRKR